MAKDTKEKIIDAALEIFARNPDKEEAMQKLEAFVKMYIDDIVDKTNIVSIY